MLVFLARTSNEVKVFGGEVFFDIDGKNVGKLSSYSQKIDLPAGNHTIKMYKSHVYDTFIRLPRKLKFLIKIDDGTYKIQT